MKTCALVIGHKKLSPGAENASSGLTEYAFNDQLSMVIEQAIEQNLEQDDGQDSGQERVHVQRVYRRTYKSLPGDINEMGPDFIISLHCNAYNTVASGTEVLYYHRSEKGRQIAQILSDQLVHALGLRDRGVRPKSAEDRGGYLLQHTAAPCIIAEPFFIDNDQDLEVATAKRHLLISAYAEGIKAMAQVI